MALPYIDPLPSAPSLSDPSNFATKADTFVAALSTFQSQVNTFLAAVGTPGLGGGDMTGALGFIAGAVGTPGLYVVGDSDTGLYSPGANQLAITTGGTQRALFGSTSLIKTATNQNFRFKDLSGVAFVSVSNDADNANVAARMDAASWLINGAVTLGNTLNGAAAVFSSTVTATQFLADTLIKLERNGTSQIRCISTLNSGEAAFLFTSNDSGGASNSFKFGAGITANSEATLYDITGSAIVWRYIRGGTFDFTPSISVSGYVSVDGFSNTAMQYRLRTGFANTASGGSGLSAGDPQSSGFNDSSVLYGHRSIGFYTGQTLRVTIGSDGSFLIGTQTNGGYNGNAIAEFKTSVQGVSFWNTASGSNNCAALFRIDNSASVFIRFNYGTTNYGQFTTDSTNLVLTATNSAVYNVGSARIHAFRINGTQIVEVRASSLAPSTDNSYTLGEGSYRWSVVYAATGSINTSDRREKSNIRVILNGIDIVKEIDPVSFTKYGQERMGFIAQDVRKGMLKFDIGNDTVQGDEEKESLGLYEPDMIAPLWSATRQIIAKTESYETRIAALERKAA